MLVSAPPTIPRTRKSEPGELDEHLTLWVRTGAAHLRLAEGRDYRIDAGSGICLSPGTEHDVWTEPGTLTVPLWSAQHPLGAPERIAPFPVAERYQTQLMERYCRWAWDDAAPFAGDDPPPAALRIRSGPDGAGTSATPAEPRLPGSGPALRVAMELSRHPASNRDLEGWAAWAGCSPSTRRRGFITQTGSTFAQWRQSSRLALAAERLRAGWRVGKVAAEVGFASRCGFAGAFRAHYGMTPRDYAARAAEASEPLVAIGPPPASAGVRAGAEPLPENVMLWVRSGELRARFAGRLWIGRVGEVVWLPAGTVVEVAPRLSVPLSTLCTACVQLERPRRARFSAAWNDWLLWASVSTNSLLKSEEHHGRVPRIERTFHDHVIEAFRAQEAVERARSVPLPTDEGARVVATDFLRALGTRTEGSAQDLPAALREAFRRETGMSVASWRQAARMRVARQLLQSGTASSAVAARVGYSMVSNFSRAFSRFHGVGPREFQAVEGADAHGSARDPGHGGGWPAAFR